MSPDEVEVDPPAREPLPPAHEPRRGLPGVNRHILLAALPAVLILGAAILLMALSDGFRSEFAYVWGILMQGDPDPLRLWLMDFGVWAPLVSTLLQIATSLIPFLPGFVLAIANAMVWGALLGGLLTFGSAILAAAACFGLARSLGRPGVERIVSPRSLRRMDGFMERRGVIAIFLGRIIPFINPDVLSYAAGVTRIGWVPFLTAMAAGAVPATVFYSIVGALAIESAAWVIGVVAVAAILPLALLWIFRDRIPR